MTAGGEWHKHVTTREDESFLGEESFPSLFGPRRKARYGLAQESGSDTFDCPQPGVNEAEEAYDPAAFLLRIIEDSEVSKRLGSLVAGHWHQHGSASSDPSKHNADVFTFEQPLASVPSRESTPPPPPTGIQSYPKRPESALAGDEPEAILPQESSGTARGLGTAAIPGMAEPRRRGAEELSGAAADSVTSGSLPASPMPAGSWPPDPALLTMGNALASKDRFEGGEGIATLLSAMESTEIAKSLGVVARSEKGAARPSAPAGPSVQPTDLRFLKSPINIPLPAKWAQPDIGTEQETGEAVAFDATASRLSLMGAEQIPKKESKPASPETILPLRSIIGGPENPTLTDRHDSTVAHAETGRDTSAASEPAALALPGERRSEASASSAAPPTPDSLTFGASQRSGARSDEAPALSSPDAAVDPPRLQMFEDGSPILWKLPKLGALSRLVKKTTRLTSKHLDRAEFHLETRFERWFEPPDPRRRSRRLANPPVVAFYWPADDPKAHEIADISFGGLHLLTQDRWPEGSIFSMCLQRTDTEKGEPGSWIAVDFRIVHWRQDGVAGAFLPSPSNMTYADAGRANNCADRKTLEGFVKRLVARAQR